MVGLSGLEPPTSRLSGVRSNRLSYKPISRYSRFFTLNYPWWRWTGSNRWPPACKAGALPAELHPHINFKDVFPFILKAGPSKLNNVDLTKVFRNSWPWMLELKPWLRSGLHRKEVIQPHLPIRLPCYDFTPVINPAFGSSLLAVGSLTSGVINSHGVTGGVYKTRERIHRDILIRDY